MIHGMLTSISYNLNRQISDVKFFEFGNTYCIEENKGFIETEKNSHWNYWKLQTKKLE